MYNHFNSFVTPELDLAIKSNKSGDERNTEPNANSSEVNQEVEEKRYGSSNGADEIVDQRIMEDLHKEEQKVYE